MDPARPEDVSRARADVDMALSTVAEAESALAKTMIRSPIDGVVLRTHVRAGETVAPSPELPLVTVADMSTLRVRAEVDEADIGRVFVGQRAWVTAPAYGEQRVFGRVVSVAPIVGRKKLTRDEPTERIDTKVLEVLVELEPDQQLPIGLRVDTFFENR
jgi:HlyD family secretion protein